MLLSDKSIRSSINNNKIFKLTGSDKQLSESDFTVKSASVDLSIGKIYEPIDGKVKNEKQLRDPHKLLPHIIHTLSDRPVSSTTELSTAKFALALADNIAYLY